MVKPNVIIINSMDNVAIALEDINEGDYVRLPDGQEFPALVDIPYSHKVALVDISAGGHVLKYGEIIGAAKEDIGKGGWIHTHNLDTGEKKRG
ncbi:MAG: UxaA family hydrolase [Thermodesulfobacteriota bacterium]|nr:UxaA family hydrolase [Thermodesulfobacteriota bacterium]